MREERDALRLRLAEVERERDELCDRTETLTKERDDARRVAKRLAQVLASNGFRWDGTIALDVWIDAALAYEVEP